jgi:hypothetical protein
MLGGQEMRREERQLSRKRVCVDRVWAVDYLSEGGGFRLSFPQLRHDRSRTCA